MTELPTVRAFGELVARGLIAAEPAAQRLPGGNVDRRDSSVRTSWRVGLPDGRAARLLLGPDLADLHQRHTAFARACPSLVPAGLFYERLSDGEAFAEEFFTGESLEAVALVAPARAAKAFARVCAALAATARPSTESARRADWQAWTATVESLRFWTPAESKLLNDLVWPRLYALLAAAPPATRWTNGDFTSANILLDEQGDTRLIDCEFAGANHFYGEDAARFHVLSPSAWRRPDLVLYSANLPPTGPAWHLFFWFRQLALETAHNTPAYLARMRPVRLGVIRRLGEQVLGCPLAGWSVDAVPVQFTMEVARWQQTARTTLCLSGWCHLPTAGALQTVVVHEGDRLVAETTPAARPDVQAHFTGAANALDTGFTLAVPIRDPDALLVLSAVAVNGTLLPFHSCQACDLPGRGPWVDDYPRWAALYDPDPRAPTDAVPGPLFSVLVPIYNTPPAFLRACLESVRRQHYSRWELRAVDDGSTGDAVPGLLREFAAADRRIRVQSRAANGGIARASNDALAAAQGDYIVLLDHDDVLRPHALAEFAARLRQDPALDAIYSDEDKISADGVRVESFLKPDFSPEYLLGVMYVGHALCVRTTVARSAGGFDSTYDGVQDFEFLLRVTERTQRIGHVSRLLYHWRQSPGSSALHGNVKGNIEEKQAVAVQAHLARRGRTERVAVCGHHRVQLHATDAPVLEIVRLAPGDEALAALRRAADSSRADVLVVVTAEPQASSENWLNDLAALAARPDSGLVAPLLLSSAGPVMESGWTVGPHGTAPMMRGFEPTSDGYAGSLLCTREVAVVSPLCFAVRRELVGPALAKASPGLSWLEFCLRLSTGGLYNRVCSTARVQLNTPWSDLAPPPSACPPDPYFNPHFDALRADYSLARPPAHLSPVIWHLDEAPVARPPGGVLHLRGWCFSAEGKPIRAIRVRAGDRTISGTVGLPRPDVKATYPEAPGDETGFEVRGALPPGRRTVTLEAGLPDGPWALLMSSTVAVQGRILPRWLGGGGWMELMHFQRSTQPVYPPRELRLEKFPLSSRSARKPKLSIVTPSFQQGRFLEETIRSVLDQAIPACQYVVQDGGSTDGSGAILRQHASRLHTWASRPDQGQADAIKRGFARTAGAPDDLMAWINADDFYLPGALSFVVDFFARHPEADVLYGHRILVDEQSQEVGRWFLPRHDDRVLRLYDFVPQETLFWRRRCWDVVGGVDTSFNFAIDWDLLLRFQEAGARIVRVPYFLACFRIHSAQKTAAAMHDLGQREINRLRERTHGRSFSPDELENDPRLIRHLRRSAFVEFGWRLGVRLT